MSMEMHVLFRGKLPRKAALTRAMKELGFPLSIVPPGSSLEQQKGYMPMRLKREETGVEFDVFNGRAAVEEMVAECEGEIDPGLDRSANFRWGGDESEMLCALCAAAALAKLVKGVVLDDQEGKLLTSDEAAEYARAHLQSVSKEPPSGTRPADIKRHLKLLLKLRPDLALVGRMLVIRPVRHLLRGVHFGRTGDKYRFSLWRYVTPLYAPADTMCGDPVEGGYMRTWEPHFQPLLIDTLAEVVFASVGQVTTLPDFADWCYPAAHSENSDLGPLSLQVVALALAGERDRAAELVVQIERNPRYIDEAKEDARNRWHQASKDIESLCAEFHAREAATAKALKIEHIWEPSPFPVEVPAAERAGRAAEPSFPAMPWISRPSWLLQEMPTQPGEVRFAKDSLPRDGRLYLLVPLTREEAAQRHRDFEEYTLAARLEDGVVCLIHRRGWDRNDPEEFRHPANYRPWVSFYVWLYGSSDVVLGSTTDDEGEGVVHFRWIDAHKRHPRRSQWHCSLRLAEARTSIQDYRTGKRTDAEAAIGAEEHASARWSLPEFGEYAELAERLRALLRGFGYGEVS